MGVIWSYLERNKIKVFLHSQLNYLQTKASTQINMFLEKNHNPTALVSAKKTAMIAKKTRN